MKTALVYFIFALSLLAMPNIKAQVPPAQVSPAQVSPAQVSPAQAPPDPHPDVEIFDGNGGYGRLSAGIDMRYVAVRDVWPGKGYYLYRKNGGEWFALDSSIEGVNLFLTKAVESADARSFLDQYLLKLLVAAMIIRQSYVIDDHFMSLYRGFEVDADLRETIEKLRPLASKQNLLLLVISGRSGQILPHPEVGSSAGRSRARFRLFRSPRSSVYWSIRLAGLRY